MKRHILRATAGIAFAISLMTVHTPVALEKTVDPAPAAPVASSTAALPAAPESPAPYKPRNPKTIAALIRCESRGKNVKIIDTNGKYSYGILQYQKATWNQWSRESGIEGDPMVPEDAIRMADWAIDQGDAYLGQWSCAHILGLVD